MNLKLCFPIMLSTLNCLLVTKLLRLKMVNLSDLVVFAFTVTQCKGVKGGMLIFDRSGNLNRPASTAH